MSQKAESPKNSAIFKMEKITCHLESLKKKKTGFIS